MKIDETNHAKPLVNVIQTEHPCHVHAKKFPPILHMRRWEIPNRQTKVVPTISPAP